jgi:glutathione S-transferase
MANYVLYYTPGACSISPHIALRESGLPFTLDKVDLRAKKTAAGDDFFTVNPSGYVPALRLPDGAVLTENAVMTQYIADQRPDAKLAPVAGTMARYRLMEWLNFIATELHKGTSPLFNPALGEGDYRTQLLKRLAARWDHLVKGIAGKPFLTGEQFTIADGYAFYVMRVWQRALNQQLAPGLVDYYQRLAARPSIAAALEAEGITA